MRRPAAAAGVLAAAAAPFTQYDGRKGQFFLPLGAEVKLLACGNTRLYGRVTRRIGSSDSETQQWFDRFSVRVGGADTEQPGAAALVTVEAYEPALLLPADPVFRLDEDNWERTEDHWIWYRDRDRDSSRYHHRHSDIAVIQSENRLQAALEQLRRAEQADRDVHSRRTLKTLNVTVAGSPLKQISSIQLNYGDSLRNGTVNVTASRERKRRIGLASVESIDINTEDMDVLVQTSVAGTFSSVLDRIQNMHLDATFNGINKDMCTGLLAELWGVKPMSRHTARLLKPECEGCHAV